MDRMAKQFPTQALAIQAELTTDQNLVDIKLAVIEKFSRLDILINCAGKLFFFLFFNYLYRCYFHWGLGNDVSLRLRLLDGHTRTCAVRTDLVLPRLPKTVARLRYQHQL